jgi:hypothetical protein
LKDVAKNRLKGQNCHPLSHPVELRIKQQNNNCPG